MLLKVTTWRDSKSKITVYIQQNWQLKILKSCIFFLFMLFFPKDLLVIYIVGSPDHQISNLD